MSADVVPPVAGGPGRARSGAFPAAWRHRRWRALVASVTLSTVGDFAVTVALVVQLMDQTGSAAWVAAMLVARMAATTLLGLFGGVAADRLERRRLLVVVEVVRAASMAVLCLLVAGGVGPVGVIAVATLFSTAGAVYWPASVSATPTLVPEDDLAAANAVEATVYQAGWFAGPALGTALLALGGPELAFGLAAGVFAISAWSAGRVGHLGPGAPDARAPSDEERFTGVIAGDGDTATAVRGAGEGWLASLLEGAAAVRRFRGLAALTIFSVAVMLAFGVEQVVQVFVVTERLGWDADGVGVLSAAIGAGGLLAAPFAGRLAASRQAGRLLALSGVTMGVTLALLAVTTSPAVALGLSLAEGVGNIAFDVLLITLLQRVCPESLLGRVYSLQDSAGSTSQLAGTAIAPVLVGVAGLEAALVVGGGTLVAMALVLMPALAAISARTEAERRRLAPVVARLGVLGLFDDASTAQLERMARAVRTLDLGAGTEVFHEGDPPDDLYVVEGGEVAVSSAVAGEVRRLGPGDWFGEIGLIRDMPRTMTVTTTVDTALLAVPGRVFVDALTGRGSLPEPVERAMSSRLARTHPAVAAVSTGPELPPPAR